MSNILFDRPGPRAVTRHKVYGLITLAGIVVVLTAVIWKLWTEDQLTIDKWEPFVTPSIMQLIGEYLVGTLQAAVLAIAGAVVLGVVLGVGKLSDHRIVRWPAWLIVEFFRAVPLLMLIIFVWAIFGYPLYAITPLVIGLILYNGSVLAEVVRAGVNAVPDGQSEAAYAVGLRKGQVMRIVLIPQAVRIMLPSIISQCIVALKDTSLGYIITAVVLTTSGRRIWNTFDNRLPTALVLAAIYIALNLILAWFAHLASKRLSSEGGSVEIVAGQVMAKP